MNNAPSMNLKESQKKLRNGCSTVLCVRIASCQCFATERFGTVRGHKFVPKFLLFPDTETRYHPTVLPYILLPLTQPYCCIYHELGNGKRTEEAWWLFTKLYPNYVDGNCLHLIDGTVSVVPSCQSFRGIVVVFLFAMIDPQLAMPSM